MKLRVRHNSIRFRLGQSEVESLWRTGVCREAVEFPGGARLEYALVASGNGKIDAGFSDGVVSVTIPKDQVAIWHDTDQIGIRADVHVHSGEKLLVLIEKDFRCIDPNPEEDESDAFANPLGVPQSCS